MFLEQKINIKLAILIIVLITTLSIATGYTANKVYDYNSYSLDSRLEEKLPKVLETIARDPKDFQARVQLGMIFLQRKEWEKGLEHLLIAKDQEPNEAQLVYHIGMAYGQLGKWEEAEKYFLEVLAIESKNDHAIFALGQLAQNKGELKEAQEYYLKAIEIENKPEYYEAAGKLYISLGQEDKGRLLLEKGEIDEHK